MRTHSQPKKKKKNLGLRYRWTVDHNRPWNDLIDISLKLYNYASHIKPSINFSTSLPSLILWPYINLNHKKCKLKNYPCLQNGERVRAATASNTIIAARMFAKHLLHQFEQKYNYLGTSNIHEQVTTPGEKCADKYWKYHVSKLFHLCMIKTTLLRTFKKKSTEAH